MIKQVLAEIKDYIDKKNILIADVAARMGVKRPNVYAILRSKNPTTKTLQALVEVLGGTLEIKFVPKKDEIELLREENEKLKKQLAAYRYTQNGTLKKT